MLARLFVVAASLLSQATAITIPIAIGRFNLTFDPSTIKVAPGDVLEFRFWARNHSVVQGTWDKACSPIAEGGFFSGFFPTQPGGPNSDVFRVTVDNTLPIIIYCSQNTGSHCKNGMSAVINPSGNNNLETYRAAARNASTAESPPSVFGGTVAPLAQSTATESGGGSSITATSTSTRTSSTPTGTNGAGSLGASIAGFVAAGAAAVVMV